MTDSCEYHCDIVIIGSFDDFLVPNRTAGLNDTDSAPVHSFKQSVGEGKERV